MSTTATDGSVLVYGATGVQGGGILEQLLDNGHVARAQTSNPGRTDALEQQGAIPIVAAFDDPDTLRSASEGVSKVILTTPSGHPSDAVRRFGRNAVDAAEQAGVEFLVLNTSTPIPNDETDVTYFEDRRVLELYLEQSDVPFVSLHPTIYMENLAVPHVAQSIVNDGVVPYPAPPGLPASWLSAGDLGAFVTETLNHPEWAGRRIPVGGPDILTGADIAAQFSAVMSQSIEYQQVPLDEYEAQLSEMMGPDVGEMIPEMYRWTETHLDSGLFERSTAELRRTFPDVALTPLKTWAEHQDWQQLAGSV